MYAEEVWQRNVRLIEDLKPIAGSRGKTMPQLALRWVLSNPAMSVAIPGMLNVQELEENCGVLDWALSGEDMRQIDEVFAKYGVKNAWPSIHRPLAIEYWCFSRAVEIGTSQRVLYSGISVKWEKSLIARRRLKRHDSECRHALRLLGPANRG